jgi:hypothetical protein
MIVGVLVSQLHHGNLAWFAEGSAVGDAEETGDGSHVIICSATGVGCSGRLRLLLTWRAQSQLHPDIDADLTLDPLQASPPVPRLSGISLLVVRLQGESPSILLSWNNERQKISTRGWYANSYLPQITASTSNCTLPDENVE